MRRKEFKDKSGVFEMKNGTDDSKPIAWSIHEEATEKVISKAKEISKKYQDCENIEHPKHYTQGIECADYVESHSMDFFQGNAVKYLTRFKHKGTPLDDLKKARWYVERLIKKYSENEN